MLINLLFKMTCVGVIAGGVMAYMMSTQGKDPMEPLRALSTNLPSLSMPDLPPIPELPKLNFLQVTAGKTKVYQWTDSQGGTQFSNSPPPHGTRYKTVEIDPNVNIIPAHVGPQQLTEIQSKKPTTSKPIDNPVDRDTGKIRQQIEQFKTINSDRIDNLNVLIQQQN